MIVNTVIPMIIREIEDQEIRITGYSLSDQNILSPIHSKYDDWFCQIYRNYSNIQNSFASFDFKDSNLCKSDKISRWILD